jgi:hypothetical protein
VSYLVKVFVRRGSWHWLCECGRSGKRGYGFIGHAQMYGESHRKAKHG